MLENAVLICYVSSIIILIMALVIWIEKNNSFDLD